MANTFAMNSSATSAWKGSDRLLAKIRICLGQCGGAQRKRSGRMLTCSKVVGWAWSSLSSLARAAGWDRWLTSVLA